MTYTSSDARYDTQTNRAAVTAQEEWDFGDGYKHARAALTDDEAVEAVKKALLSRAEYHLDAGQVSIVEDRLRSFLKDELGILIDAVIG